MIWSLISGLLGANENLTKQQNAAANTFNSDIANARARQQQARQQVDLSQANANGNIDMQNIINGVFTGKQKNNTGLPNGFLGG